MEKWKQHAAMDDSLPLKPDKEISKELQLPETQEASKRRSVAVTLVWEMNFCYGFGFSGDIFDTFMSNFIWHFIIFVCVLLQKGCS